MSCDGNRAKFFAHVLASAGGGSSVTVQDLETIYDAHRGNPANTAEALLNDGKTRALFRMMQDVEITPPTHSQDGLPRRESRRGYARLYDEFKQRGWGAPAGETVAQPRAALATTPRLDQATAPAMGSATLAAITAPPLPRMITAQDVLKRCPFLPDIANGERQVIAESTTGALLHDWARDALLHSSSPTDRRIAAYLLTHPEGLRDTAQHLCDQAGVAKCSQCGQWMGADHVCPNKRFDGRGYNRNGFNRMGYNAHGLTQVGYDYDGYTAQGYDRAGYNRRGYNAINVRRGQTVPDSGYVDRSGESVDADGYTIQGYKFARDRDGYTSNGCDQDGYDRNGYDIQGRDRSGRLHPMFTRDTHGFYGDGYDAVGYGRDGYDGDGYDGGGYNRDGYDAAGYDRDGYNRAGFNADRRDRAGRNKEGFDTKYQLPDGYNTYGYGADGYNQAGYNQEGFNRDGYTVTGFDKDGKDATGQPRMVLDRKKVRGPAQYNLSGVDKQQCDHWGFNKRTGLSAPDATGKQYSKDGWVYDSRRAVLVNPCNPNDCRPHKFYWHRYPTPPRVMMHATSRELQPYVPVKVAPPLTPWAPSPKGIRRAPPAPIETRWVTARAQYDPAATLRGIRLKCSYCGQFTGGRAHICPSWGEEPVLVWASGVVTEDTENPAEKHIIFNPATPNWDPHYRYGGYSQAGSDPDGYNRQGFRDGLTRTGYNREGYDVFSYDRDGYDRDGYDRQGRDRDGNPRPRTIREASKGLEEGEDPLTSDEMALHYGRVAASITGQPTRVIFDPTIASAATDMKGTIVVNPHPLGQDADPRANMVTVKSYIYHELGHELTTPPEDWAWVLDIATSDVPVDGIDEGRKIIPKVYNVIEDGRMERDISDRFPGVAETIAAAARLQPRWHEQVGSGASTGDQVFWACLYEALPYFRVRQATIEAMTPAARALFEQLQPIVRQGVLGEPHDSLTATLDMTRILQDAGVLDVPPDLAITPPPEKLADKGRGTDARDGANGQGQPGNGQGAAQADGQHAGSASADGDRPGNGGGASGMFKDDSDGSGGPAPDQRGQGGGTQSEAFNQDQAQDAGGGGAGQPGEAGEAAGGSGSADGAGQPGTAGSATGAGSAAAGAVKPEQPTSTGRTTTPGGEQPAQSMPHGGAPGNGDGSGGVDATYRRIQHGALRDPAADFNAGFDEAALERVLRNADREAAGVIDAQVRKGARYDALGEKLHRALGKDVTARQRYRTSEGVVSSVEVTTPKLDNPTRLRQLATRRPQHKAIAGQLGRQLERIRAAADERIRFEKSGRLDPRRYVEALQGVDEVYERVQEQPQTSMAVSITLDFSGSMHGGGPGGQGWVRSGMVYDATRILGDTFTALDMPYEVRGHGSSARQYKAMAEPTFDEQRAACMSEDNLLGNSCTAPVMGLSTTALLGRSEANKLLVSLMDGDMGDHKETREQLAEARKHGVVTFGMFLGTPNDGQATRMTELFGRGNWARLGSMTEMPRTVGKRLAGIFESLGPKGD